MPVTFGVNDEDWQKAVRVLFSVNCMELSSTSHELTLMGSSLGLHLDTAVALILLPPHVEFDHRNLLIRMCEVTWKRSNTASSGQLQIIICLPCVEIDKHRQSEEEENVKRALEWLPQGSCAIPLTDIKRRFLFQKLFFGYFWKGGKRVSELYDRDIGGGKLMCFIADVRMQDNGSFLLLDCQAFGEDNISEKLIQNSDKSESDQEEDEIPDELQDCIKMLCNVQTEEEERAKLKSLKNVHPSVEGKGHTSPH